MHGHFVGVPRAALTGVRPITLPDFGFPVLERVTFSAVRCLHHAISRGTLPGASGEFFHAVGDNLRQLHYLLAQFSVFRNVALNAVAIGL